jgi:hypothetical protein
VHGEALETMVELWLWPSIVLLRKWVMLVVLLLNSSMLVALLSSRALNNRQRLFYLVNGLHQPTGEKRQGLFPTNPLSNLLGSLHVGTRVTCE